MVQTHTYQLYTFFSGEAKTSDDSDTALDCKHPILLIHKVARLSWRRPMISVSYPEKAGEVTNYSRERFLGFEQFIVL